MKNKKPKYKQKKYKVQVINPLRKRCCCGKKVTDHHFYCNDCHRKRQRNQHYRKISELKHNGGFILQKVEVLPRIIKA
jgi:hypothetical protein